MIIAVMSGTISPAILSLFVEYSVRGVQDCSKDVPAVRSPALLAWIPITAVYFHTCRCSEISLAFNRVFGKSLLLQHWHNKSFNKKLAFLKVLLSPNVFTLRGSNKVYQKEAEMRLFFPLHHSSKPWNILVWRVEHEIIILHSENIFSTQSFFSFMNISTLSACLTVCPQRDLQYIHPANGLFTWLLISFYCLCLIRFTIILMCPWNKDALSS